MKRAMRRVGPKSGRRLLDHTADIGIEVWGGNLPDCLAEAAYALTDLMAGEEVSVGGEGEEPWTIEIDAEDEADLLVNWLSHLLYIFETEGLLIAEVEIDSAGETGLSASARMVPFDEELHSPEVLPKAITYHMAELVRVEDGGWRGRVYLDI